MMNIFTSKKLNKILPLLTARYSILCTRRLQPPRDGCAVRVQWFSSVNLKSSMVIQVCHFVDYVMRWLDHYIGYDVLYIHRTKNKGTLVFHFLFYPKHIKDMEFKSLSGLTSTSRNPCTTPVGHTEDDTAHLCSRNLLSFPLKCNTKFLEKYKGSLIYI